MINKNIAKKISIIKKNVDEINEIMAELYTDQVEIRISYKDSSMDQPPQIDLWRATEHVDYLQKSKETK